MDDGNGNGDDDDNDNHNLKGEHYHDCIHSCARRTTRVPYR